MSNSSGRSGRAVVRYQRQPSSLYGPVPINVVIIAYSVSIGLVHHDHRAQSQPRLSSRAESQLMSFITAILLNRLIGRSQTYRHGRLSGLPGSRGLAADPKRVVASRLGSRFFANVPRQVLGLGQLRPFEFGGSLDLTYSIWFNGKNGFRWLPSAVVIRP